MKWMVCKLKHVDPTKLSIMWLNDAKNTHIQYYYLENELNTISTETIICNGVEFEFVFGEKLLWRLLTPIAFITTITNDKIL